MMTRSIHNLALIGFMGTGKSSVGRTVAHVLHYDFLDTDAEIESQAGKAITRIFAENGEPAFRELERSLLVALADRRKTVIATGGGLPVFGKNLELLKEHALVVCLWASPEVIFERVRIHSHRPLLAHPDPINRIRELLAQRECYYRQADVLVNTELRSVREVALNIVHHFHMAQAAHS